MYKIFIVENDVNDWTLIYNWLKDKNFEVYPPRDQFDGLRSALSKKYSSGNSDQKRNAGREVIQQMINEHNIDLFIVDYELKKNQGKQVNGLLFCDEFLTNKKFLIVTAMKDIATINEINVFCKHPESDHLCKNMADTGTFRDQFLKKIDRMLPPQSPSRFKGEDI